ncbi:hypothetical protein L6Q96_07810 [Candidatus Binatia bacterium]|nr:hypothetical protein [Candidatus Binatia bacterium]
MRGLKRNPWLVGRGVLLAALVLCAGQARADVFTDQSGSVVIFPKVVSDGVRDTVIQLANTSNYPAQAHCFYVNAMGYCSQSIGTDCTLDRQCPAGELCVPQWTEIDFDLQLTGQQPTQWRVSTGRSVDYFVKPCRPGDATCACTVDPFNGGLICPGLQPGTGGQGSLAVKPVGTSFIGELKCVQVLDDFDAPSGQNSLKGEAYIETLANGQISKYNATGVSARAVASDNLLLLNNVEYNLCPASLGMNHFAEGAQEPFTGAVVGTELTLVPCTELFEQQIPTRSRAIFTIYNEYEQPLSADLTFDCFVNRQLSDISLNFSVGTLGTMLAHTRITPPSSSICLTGDNRGLPCGSDSDCPNARPSGSASVSFGCRPWTGLLGVAEEFYVRTQPAVSVTTAAYELTLEGSRAGVGDVIELPLNP